MASRETQRASSSRGCHTGGGWGEGGRRGGDEDEEGEEQRDELECVQPRVQRAKTATVEIHRRIRHTFKNYMNCTCVKNDANRRRYVDAAACQSLLGKNAMGQTSPYILDSPNL
ncbi:unnamed protein product [Prorocentrum cordatum]|uniref:Uncharacterized protein n=1 Tax=Prorocentrum cordatum TaxID=2364126 RepID=A0ABN9SVP5_9DINO|nr:unnamed protein product [Polarella glacialis]